MVGASAGCYALRRICLVAALGLVASFACGPKLKKFASVDRRLPAKTQLVLLPAKSEFPSTRVDIDETLRKSAHEAGFTVLTPAPSEIRAWGEARFEDRYRAACSAANARPDAIVAAPTVSIGTASRRECHLKTVKSFWNILPDPTPDREQGLGTIWTTKRKCEGQNRAYSVLEIVIVAGPSCESVATLATAQHFEDDIPSHAERKAMARPINAEAIVELLSRVVTN